MRRSGKKWEGVERSFRLLLIFFHTFSYFFVLLRTSSNFFVLLRTSSYFLYSVIISLGFGGIGGLGGFGFEFLESFGVVGGDEFRGEKHGDEGDREKDEAGTLVVDAAGEFGEAEAREDDDGKDAPNVSDDREDDRKGEKKKLLPKTLVKNVGVDGGDHHHGNEGANSTAALGDFKTP